MKERKINLDCPCDYDTCPRHRDCEACKAYHHALNQKTSCEKQDKRA
jgi:hypothetical protein